MTSLPAYQCACGILLEGSVAIKHILRCKSRQETSPLMPVCAEYRNKASLLYELLAEAQVCCGSRISAKKIERMLKLVEPEVTVNEPDSDFLICVVCKEPSALICLRFECNHTFCQSHFKQLYGKSTPKCPFPGCTYLLSESEVETVNMFSEACMEERKEEPVEDGCKCSACGRTVDMGAVVFLDCMHSVCEEHIKANFDREYASSNTVSCPVQKCHYVLSCMELETIVGKEALEKIDEERTLTLLRETSSTLAKCSHCDYQCSLDKGSVDFNYKDAAGHAISREAAIHMAEFRLRCPNCNTTTCVGCNVSPYHEGRTCEEYGAAQKAKHCRYCEEIVPIDIDCCQGQDCQDRLQSACKKRLECGHPCYGVQGEEVCPPCLHDDCQREGLSGRDLCVICYTEELAAAPFVLLDCGHGLHYHCLKTSLEKRWNGPRITFKFAKCPSCNSWALPTNLPELATKVQLFQQLYREITDKALKRLQFEGEDKLPRLSDPNDDYFQQPEKYAMDRFCYYECFRCKAAYFGGKKDCQQQDVGKAYDPSELICAKCGSEAVAGAAECPTHGGDYIQFKCRFCCSFAVWFCWGTTHFCEPCHQAQVNGQNVAAKKKDQLPRCAGAECPLKVQHPPNGEEFGMGCGMCRDLKANVSDF